MSSARHGGDALPVDVGRGDRVWNAIDGQDRRLRGGVVAVDVGGGVGLGVAERGGLGQRLGEAGAGLGHAGEDVVGRAVDDAHDPADAVAGQRLPQRAHQRDRAGHRGLVVEVDARPAAAACSSAPSSASSALLAVTTGLPAANAARMQRAGRLDPAHHLDDDVDVGRGGPRRPRRS